MITMNPPSQMQSDALFTWTTMLFFNTRRCALIIQHMTFGVIKTQLIQGPMPTSWSLCMRLSLMTFPTPMPESLGSSMQMLLSGEATVPQSGWTSYGCAGSDEI